MIGPGPKTMLNIYIDNNNKCTKGNIVISKINYKKTKNVYMIILYIIINGWPHCGKFALISTTNGNDIYHPQPHSIRRGGEGKERKKGEQFPHCSSPAVIRAFCLQPRLDSTPAVGDSSTASSSQLLQWIPLPPSFRGRPPPADAATLPPRSVLPPLTVVAVHFHLPADIPPTSSS